MNTMLPVHCCCDPKLRLGWVPVPTNLQDIGRSIRFTVRTAGYELPAPMGEVVYRPAEIITTFIGQVFTPRPVGEPAHVTLAVNSSHLPIETWRKVPGFIDETEMARLRAGFEEAAAASGVLERGE